MRVTKKSVVDDGIVRRILKIMKEKGVSQQELERFLGLGNGIFTHWKYNGSKSYLNYIDRIAECLNVSKNYLLEGRDDSVNNDSMSLYEIEVIKMLRDLDAKKRDLSYQTIKMFWTDAMKLKESRA